MMIKVTSAQRKAAPSPNGPFAVDTAGPAPIARFSRAAAPLRQQVLDSMRQSIVDGRFKPGARLIERELIDGLGVSRTVVREVLRQLESEGLITVVPNKGAVVRELTVRDAKDLYSIRSVLEGLAARQFAENAEEADIKQLEQALDATIKAYRGGDPETIFDTKNRFYEILFEGAASETLSLMLNAIHARISSWRARGLTHPKRSRERSTESIAGLRELVTLLKRRNAKSAEMVARREVNKAAAEMIRLLRLDRPSEQVARRGRDR